MNRNYRAPNYISVSMGSTYYYRSDHFLLQRFKKGEINKRTVAFAQEESPSRKSTFSVFMNHFETVFNEREKYEHVWEWYLKENFTWKINCGSPPPESPTWTFSLFLNAKHIERLLRRNEFIPAERLLIR